jgi:hypothetical protein
MIRNNKFTKSYAQKLWIGDFVRDVVYLPFKQSNRNSRRDYVGLGRIHRCKEYTKMTIRVSSSCSTSTRSPARGPK